ncbi:MAG: hypothetical protein AB1705_07665 [Verrucomicrobiota bacterium]
MADQYQRGTDKDWQKAEVDELRFILKKRDGTIWRLRFYNAALLAVIAWVVFKFVKIGQSITDLWKL